MFLSRASFCVMMRHQIKHRVHMPQALPVLCVPRPQSSNWPFVALFVPQDFAASACGGSAFQLLALCAHTAAQRCTCIPRAVSTGILQAGDVCYMASAAHLGCALVHYQANKTSLLAEASKLPYMKLR